MPFLTAAFLGTGVSQLFDYNRKSHKFDYEQQISREIFRMEMQIRRFELFREDIRDLVRLTVDRMDVYHVVGALFLQFCIVILTKGRIQAAAPPFLLSLFLMTAACAFIYLLLAVWMSVHASIASHSFGTKLLTRFVRLPIPSVKQLDRLTFKLKDLEKKGIGSMLRVPFAEKFNRKGSQDDVDDVQNTRAKELQAKQQMEAEKIEELLEQPMPDNAERNPPQKGSPQAIEAAMAVLEDDPDRVLGKRFRPNFDEDTPLLPEEEVSPIIDGGDDLLSSRSGALPERHIQLFRILQAKWQCYDAYCRVCMSLGVNQMLQILSYYAITHTVVENQSPTTGLALVFMFQCCTVALGVFDLAGLKRREIIAVQAVGVLPCLLSVIGVAHGTRNVKGELDATEPYALSPLSFLLTVFWLELWLRISSPSSDRSRLPRRFRQVLFLDVFGDASTEDPCEAEKQQVNEGMCPILSNDDEQDEQRSALAAVGVEKTQRVVDRFTTTRWAVMRWMAVPTWAFTSCQKNELEAYKTRVSNVGNTVRSEYDQLRLSFATLRLPLINITTDLISWGSVPQDDRFDDPFAGFLVGPFSHDGVKAGFLFDIEQEKPIFDEAESAERGLVLSFERVGAYVYDLESEVSRLLEFRIVNELRQETSRRHIEKVRASPALAAAATFPNLVGLVEPGSSLRQRTSSKASSGGTTSAPLQEEMGGNDTQSSGARAVRIGRKPLRKAARTWQKMKEKRRRQKREKKREQTQDPTYTAVAGKHADHFVPERLPWQLLSNMTRVLQVCWFWAFVMAMLREMDIFALDEGIGLVIQQKAGAGNHDDDGLRLRRLCYSDAWRFTSVEIRGQTRAFHRAEGLSCFQRTEGRQGDRELFVSTPFALYSAAPADDTSSVWDLKEGARSRIFSTSISLCVPLANPADSGNSFNSTCWLSAIRPDGVALWPIGQDYRGLNAHLFRFQGSRWLHIAGTVTNCHQVAHLMNPTNQSTSTNCVVLVGWDGSDFPVVVLPLPPSAGVSNEVRPLEPAMQVPGQKAVLVNRTDTISALHVDNFGGLRLWAVWGSGELHAWDLLRARSLGYWRPTWPIDGVPPTALVVCNHMGGGFTGQSDDMADAVIYTISRPPRRRRTSAWVPPGAPILSRVPLPMRLKVGARQARLFG